MSTGREEPDGTVDFAALLGALEDERGVEAMSPSGDESAHAAIVDYLEHVRECPSFELTLLPLGDALTITARGR